MQAHATICQPSDVPTTVQLCQSRTAPVTSRFVNDANSRWQEQQFEIIVQSFRQLFDSLRDCAFRSEPVTPQPEVGKRQHEADYHPRHWNSEQTGNQISKHFRDQDEKRAEAY